VDASVKVCSKRPQRVYTVGMRCDGEFTIYVLEARYTTGKDKKWFRASLDSFGTPPGFSASGECWQKTGIHGTFDEAQGVDAAMVMAREHVEFDWRLMRLEVSQHHHDVVTFSAKKPGAQAPDGYPVTKEMRARYDAIHKGA